MCFCFIIFPGEAGGPSLFGLIGFLFVVLVPCCCFFLFFLVLSSFLTLFI